MSQKKTYSLAVMPASVADARAQRLLPGTPSDDASSLLVVPPPPEFELTIGPEPKNAWLVEATRAGGGTMTNEELRSRFDARWERASGINDLFGQLTPLTVFDYVRASGALQTFDRAIFSVDLVELQDTEVLLHDEGSLVDILERVRNQAKDDFVIAATEHPRDAAMRAERNLELVRTTNLRALVRLVSETAPFDGALTWDVMLSLGLKWGDMDMFHWTPYSEGPLRHAPLFSVSSPKPGGILPEEIAAGHGFTELEFSFSVPRAFAPMHVLSALASAATYAQKRLGGALLNDDGSPFDLNVEAETVRAVIESFKNHGWQPGESAALVLFPR